MLLSTETVCPYYPDSEEGTFLCLSDMQTSNEVLVTLIREQKGGVHFE